MTDDDIKKILIGNELAEIENAIANECRTYVNKDFIDFTINVIRREITHSDLTLAYIRNQLVTKKDAIIKFGIQLLKSTRDQPNEKEYPDDEEPLEKSKKGESAGIGIGFGIKYAVYFHFLANKQAELLTYLKKERIPHAQKFFKSLKQAYNS